VIERLKQREAPTPGLSKRTTLEVWSSEIVAGGDADQTIVLLIDRLQMSHNTKITSHPANDSETRRLWLSSGSVVLTWVFATFRLQIFPPITTTQSRK